jgi:metal-responsive CopG/Arc/MetJ family transcriptional regulator
MRALVDIPDDQLRALDELSRSNKQSRAALVRQAINDYLGKHRRAQARDAFGLWGSRTVDGLEYQERIRKEW